MDKTRILIVDDEEPIRKVLFGSLADEGYQIQLAANGEQALETIHSFAPHVVLLDIWMPGGMDGIAVLQEIKRTKPNIDVIMMSGHGSIETAVKATKLGAWDFVEKPLSIEKISILLSNVLQFQQERDEKMALLNKLRKSIAMIGQSPAMIDLKQLIARVAPSSSWVLITGENGTGKELVARNIHYLSQRASGPLLEVNCAAIPDDLIESELFGYEKGAFTGADKAKRGKFDLANGGTIFLDEIGDMSLKTQAKILRILQEKTFYRVGGTQPVQADVRVIAATNKILVEEIKAGRFREDLYFRLNVIPFFTPPLRSRASDIPSLVTHFSSLFAKDGAFRQKIITDEAMALLQAYHWPGNVRELRNFVERLYILVPDDIIDVPDLRIAGLQKEMTQQEAVIQGAINEATLKEARAQFEKEFILRKINEHQGNITKTAESIGLERSYLHRKIKSYGLDVE